MKAFIPVTAAMLVLSCATGVRAQIPAGNPYVDPKAPCFRWPAVDMDGDGVFDRIDHCPSTRKGCAVDEYGCDTDADGDGVCDGIDQCPNTPRGTKVNDRGCERGMSAATSPKEKPAETTKPMSEMERQLTETGRIRLENVYFETGSAKLLPESEIALREAGETLEKYPNLKIEVQGHTDTRGASAYNEHLSDSRAHSVRAFLLEHFKLQADHIVAKGYGESEPETHERNDEELLRNRRVELHVLNPSALPKGVKVVKP